MVAVHEDFLPEPQFRAVRDLLMTGQIAWHFMDHVVTTERHFMFTHTFMDDGKLVNPYFFAPIQAMLGFIQQKQRFIGVSRIRANLYTNQRETIKHPVHVDIPVDSGVSEKYCIAVFHVNTCNGCTVVGDRQVTSRENQLVVFDNVPHYGTTQTDTDTRVLINFNLRTKE